MDIDKFVAKPGCKRKDRFCAKCQKLMLISTAKFCSKACRDTSKQFMKKHVSVKLDGKKYLLDDIIREFGIPRRTLLERINAGKCHTFAEFTRPPRDGMGSPPLLGFEKRNVQALRDAWL